MSIEVWFLWITYILFAEKFKAKINANIFLLKTFIFYTTWFNFRKNCASIQDVNY